MPSGLALRSWGPSAHAVTWNYEVELSPEDDLDARFGEVLEVAVAAVANLGEIRRIGWRTWTEDHTGVTTLMTASRARPPSIKFGRLAGVEIDVSAHGDLPDGGIARGIGAGHTVYIEPIERTSAQDPSAEPAKLISLDLAISTRVLDPWPSTAFGDNREMAALNAYRLTAFFSAIRNIAGAHLVEVEDQTAHGPNGYLDISAKLDKERNQALEAWNTLISTSAPSYPTGEGATDHNLRSLFRSGPTATELAPIFAGLGYGTELHDRHEALFALVNRRAVFASDNELRAITTRYVEQLHHVAAAVDASRFRFATVGTTPGAATSIGDKEPDHPHEAPSDTTLIQHIADTFTKQTHRAYLDACNLSKSKRLNAYLWAPLTAASTTDIRALSTAYYELWKHGADCHITAKTIHIWRRAVISYDPPD